MLNCLECTKPTDMVLESSEGVKFGAHNQFLSCYSEAFPSTGEGVVILPDDVVKLSENTEIVTLMLQFMHPKPPPELHELPFSTLAQMAEAAEKYRIYAAMTSCKLLMRQAAMRHPLEVMLYAITHGYDDLLEEASPCSISLKEADVFSQLDGRLDIYSAWTLYKQEWIDKNMVECLRSAMKYTSGTRTLRAALEITTTSPNGVQFWYPHAVDWILRVDGYYDPAHPSHDVVHLLKRIREGSAITPMSALLEKVRASGRSV
ncbi:hypothetical protein C8J56DRAFT_814433 [Mycena floridula]|nr:hypothetical protein C8J56DRAFT_814433 [Mycena floridula]